MKVIFQSKNSLSSLFHFKDSIPTTLFKCLFSSSNISYNGKTGLHLNVSSREHLRLIALTDKHLNSSKKLAFKDHCFFLNSVGSFENFSILIYE